MQLESSFLPSVGKGGRVSEVKVGDKLVYTIRYTYVFMRYTLCCEVYDTRGKLVEERYTNIRKLRTWLDLSIPSYPLEYLIGFFRGRSFVTPEGKIPTYFKIKEGYRLYEMDNMEFMHVDFHSEIEFSCPEDRLIQAILIACVLFNPPLQDRRS